MQRWMKDGSNSLLLDSPAHKTREYRAMKVYLLEANIQFALVCESISAEKNCHFVSSPTECSNRQRWNWANSIFSNEEAVQSYSFQLGNWHLIRLVPNITTSSEKWDFNILLKKSLTSISIGGNLSQLCYTLTSGLNLTQRHYKTGGNKNTLVLTLYVIKINTTYRT